MIRGLDIELDERGNIPGRPSFYLPQMDKEARREAEDDESAETETDTDADETEREETEGEDEQR